MINIETLLWSFLFCAMNVAALEVGDTICGEGYIMDFYCINQGRMIDNGLPTLEQPEEHSVHCLVEVGSCINANSPFEVLIDPQETGGLYTRGWRMTEEGKAKMISLAQGIGSCSTCVNGYDNSKQRYGFRSVFSATVLNLNSGTKDPPLIEINELAHSNNIEGDPCQQMFNMTNIIEELGTNSTLFSSGVDGSLRAMHVAHGSLMLFSWGLLLPLGAVFARFFKHRPDGLWFKVHRALQILGLFFAIIGWIIALRNFDVFADFGFNNRRHGIMGMVTMVLGLLQPLNAVFRPHAPEKGEEKDSIRFIWELLHKGSGYFALLLAAATIILGTTILPEPSDQMTFQVVYGLGCVGTLLFVILWLKWDEEKNPPEPATAPEERDMEQR